MKSLEKQLFQANYTIEKLKSKLDVQSEQLIRAHSCWLSGHFEDCFRELESFLPDEWIGFADSVMKRMK